MEIKKVENVEFACPYCNETLQEVLEQQVKINAVATKPMYACPHCKKVLPGPNSL